MMSCSSSYIACSPKRSLKAPAHCVTIWSVCADGAEGSEPDAAAHRLRAAHRKRPRLQTASWASAVVEAGVEVAEQWQSELGRLSRAPGHDCFARDAQPRRVERLDNRDA